MNEPAGHDHDYRFLTGLVMGSIVGGALAMLLAPRAAAEMKARAVGSAKDLGTAISARYRNARLRVTDSVDRLARKGEGVRDNACDTVVRGAEGVERGAREIRRYATEAKTHKIA